MKAKSHRKRKLRLDNHSILWHSNYNKKSLEGKFQNKIQAAVSGTESTVKTDAGKIINRKFFSGPSCQTDRRTKKKPAINTNGEMNPKNRHRLQSLGRQARTLGRNTP